MSATFFKSENVNIFPCARRGNYTEGGTNKTYNAESRFVSEANLTKLSGLAFGRDSYIISRPAEETAAAGIWKLVIKGYYFEIGVKENELQSEGYFIIGLEDTGCIPRRRLAALTDSSDSLAVNTDATSLDVDGSCNAICFSTIAPATGALYYVHSEDTLENLDKSYAKSEGVDARLDVIEGKGEGSVEKALVDAKAYAKAYADGLASNYDAAGAAADVASDLSEHVTKENPHVVTKLQVGLGNVDNKSVEEIKKEFTGSVADGNNKFVTGDMVFDAITVAKAEVVGGAISNDSTAQTVEGAKRYADSLDAALKTDIEALKTAIGLGTQGGSGDTSITNRVAQAEGNIKTLEGKVYTLVGSDADKSIRTIAAGEAAKIVAGADAKYDTLKEIADFIMGDETGAAAMANDIDSLEKEFAEGGRVDALEDEFAKGGRVTQAEADIEAVEGRVDDLEAIVAGYGAEGAIKIHVDAVSERAETAHTAINELNAVVFGTDAVGTEGNEGYESATPGLDDKVRDLEGKVEALENTVGNADSGLTTRVNTAESNIIALQSLTSGYTSEGAIKAAIEDAKKAGTEAADAVETVAANLQANYLSKTDVEGNKLGIYAVAFDLSNYSGSPEDLEEAILRPIVFISGLSTLPEPPKGGYAWFDHPDGEAKVEDKDITTNIILYLKKLPEENSGDTSEA